MQMQLRKKKYCTTTNMSYEGIDRLLKLKVGSKVLTPKGPRVIANVYPYFVTVKTRHDRTECFTKGSLLVAATLKAEGEDYRDKEEL